MSSIGEDDDRDFLRRVRGPSKRPSPNAKRFARSELVGMLAISSFPDRLRARFIQLWHGPLSVPPSQDLSRGSVGGDIQHAEVVSLDEMTQNEHVLSSCLYEYPRCVKPLGLD